jgi:predicted nucleic acid-binding protein
VATTNPVLVDTNVILDIVDHDPTWQPWSSAQLGMHGLQAFTNPLIYAELCSRATSTSEVDRIMATLGLQYQEFPKQALFLTAKAFLLYKQRGGTKTSPLPDFFIGAHAEAEGFTVLTRDPTRYRTYFPSVPLICP